MPRQNLKFHGAWVPDKSFRAEKVIQTPEPSNPVPFGGTVKSLCVFPKDADIHVALDRQLAQEIMPHLAHLRIESGKYSASTGERVRSPGPYTYTLRAAAFPVLHTLMLRDTLATLDTPLCRHLRFLHLEHQEKDTHRLPLGRLLDILDAAILLEELYVENYIDISTSALTHPLPVVSLEHRTRLKRVWFGDEPRIVGKILSHLIIPRRTNVIAVGYVDERPEVGDFRAMLRSNTSNLQIMRTTTEIRIRDTEDDACGRVISAISQYGNPENVAFDMELQRIPSSRYDPTWERDGKLLRSMVETLGLFQSCPVYTLKVAGNLKYATEKMWAAAFDRFPDLEAIEVEDIQAERTDSLYALIAALGSQSAMGEGAVCPRLASLSFKGRMYGVQLAAVVFGCVAQRTRHGARRLRKVKISVIPDIAWNEATDSLCRQVLGDFAAVVDLEISRAPARN
ncbi:hypothetical protein TRAPUB_4322 [Trametes pubescens]|uniref:Uncharacterized protein n=1 Tax=Trametes pubescens TaxID=154538 RepID=A0A1M2W7D8_TRAPU|nr:hypothetical protein TRAPUB_4322 [Trametes pubescens]